jgi:hypothetical protein
MMYTPGKEIIGDKLDDIGRWDGKTPLRQLPAPYIDPRQQEINFGIYSFYLQPWRAYMDTWDKNRFSMPGRKKPTPPSRLWPMPASGRPALK